ncbi:MAG: hypothetical protein R3284_10495 [Rubricoccaceae bacterium]|nr:hypothetical protein [Rubricoccaceae bacterium]
MTESDKQVIQLLTEIRDDQRKQIKAYEAATKRSLDMQQEAVERQRLAVKVYIRALIVGGVLIAGLLALLLYLMRLL